MHIASGRVAAITGAGLGMGRELALQLASAGMNLALLDFDTAALAQTASDCRALGVRVSEHVVDVRDRAAVKAAAAEAAAFHNGHIHIVFANAGVASIGAFDAMAEEEFDRVMEINLHGVVSTVRYFLPFLRAQAKACVVITSSVAGFFPSDKIGVPYTTSKFAARGFAESLLVEARELYPHVHVACVHPGVINTSIIDASPIDPDARIVKEGGIFGTASKTGKASADAVALHKEGANKFYNQFGYSAAEASAMIIAGVKGEKTRILVGWDAVIIDWWVRAFPRIFINPVGKVVVPLTAIILRKAYLPAAALTALAVLVWKMRGGRGGARL